MDSAGLGALIGGIRRAREAGGDVAVACSRPTLTRLLHTTGFDRIVSVTETVDDAADGAARPSPPTRPELARRRAARSAARSQVRRGSAASSVEAVEVVDVGAQERHPDHRRRRHLLGQAGQVLLLAGGDERKSARLP